MTHGGTILRYLSRVIGRAVNWLDITTKHLRKRHDREFDTSGGGTSGHPLRTGKGCGIAAYVLILSISQVWADVTELAEEESLLSLYGDEEIISIATGSRQSIARAPAVATIITAEDIKAIGATDLDEVLETVPGLHVSRDFLGYNPIYTIRGVYSQRNPQVLLLINGIPITNLFQGDRNQVWGGMPVEGIARIEVMRGPGSAIYGADSLAGVINIITKSRDDIPSPEVGLRRGSFDTWDAWALYGGTWAGTDVALSLEFGKTDGQREQIDADAQSVFDGILGTNASLAPGAVNLGIERFDARLDIERGNWRVRAGWQARREGETGAGLAQALDPNGRFASDRWNADLTYHNAELVENMDLIAQASYLDTSQEVERNTILFPPGAVLPIGPNGNISTAGNPVLFSQGFIGNPEVFERHARFGISGFYRGLSRHVLRAGSGFDFGEVYDVRETKNYGPSVIDGTVPVVDGDLTDVSGTRFAFLPKKNRKNVYFFLQDVWDIARDWELTAGLRYDNYSDFGDTVNPRLALVWSARYDVNVKLLYGQAFRAPSFAELFNQNNPVVLGNPDLDPETIRTLELALDYQPRETMRFAINGFHYWWDDIIRFVPDLGGASSTAQNEGEQTGFGLELEAEWEPIRSIRLLGNYAFQKSTDQTTDADAGNAPHHQLYARAQWEFYPYWHLTPQINWIIDRARPAGDPRPTLEDYAIVDVTLRRKAIFDHLEVALKVQNLFDVDAREPSPSPGTFLPNDLPLAGRSLFAEIRYYIDAQY
jgi:outer membrane cobalamin receptor